MKVLSAIPTVATRAGGGPAFVGGCVDALSGAGHSMVVAGTDIALAPAGPLQRQHRLTESEIHPSIRPAAAVYRARFPRRLAYSPELRRALPGLVAAADVVHIHNLWMYPQYAAAKAAREHGRPYVVSLHGGFDPFIRTRGRARKAVTSRVWQDEMLERAALIHVTTTDEESNAVDIAPRVPRCIVPCGIDFGEFQVPSSPDALREQHLGGYRGPVVLFLGRLAYKKGLDRLIEAFALVRRDLDCRLMIVGPDDEGLTTGLRSLASGLGVGEEVAFTGPLYDGDRLSALAASDLFCLPSHAENFGIAVVEAMAAGCPVLISPDVSLSGAILAANAGFVADPEPRSLAAGIESALGDESRRRELGEAARGFARSYDWEVLAPQLVEMYRTAVERGNFPA